MSFYYNRLITGHGEAVRTTCLKICNGISILGCDWLWIWKIGYKPELQPKNNWIVQYWCYFDGERWSTSSNDNSTTADASWTQLSSSIAGAALAGSGCGCGWRGWWRQPGAGKPGRREPKLRRKSDGQISSSSPILAR